MLYQYTRSTVPISWTKRYVRLHSLGLRGNLKRLKHENRVHKRPCNLLVTELLKVKRKPFRPYQPQRRNYNTVYGRMQIPV